VNNQDEEIVGSPLKNGGTNVLNTKRAKPFYVDQIPPIDCVITAANEYGHYAQKSIIGIEILNVGSGISIDDITIDEAMTYIARKITPWRNQTHIDSDTGQVSDIKQQRAAGVGDG